MISAVGVTSSRNPPPSTSFTGRILTVALTVMSGFRWTAAQNPFLIQRLQEDRQGLYRMTTTASGDSVLAVWVGAGRIYGVVADVPNRTQGAVEKLGTIAGSYDAFGLSVDCCQNSCEVAYRSHYSFPNEGLWTGLISLNGSKIISSAPLSPSINVARYYTIDGVDAACNCEECSIVFWRHGGADFPVSLERWRRRIGNSTFSKQTLQMGLVASDRPTGIYVGGQFATFFPQKASQSSPFANITMSLWTADGSEALSSVILNYLTNGERRQPVAGCFSPSLCLAAWLTKNGTWKETGRYFDAGGTPLGYITSRDVGSYTPSLKIAVSGRLALIGQSNRTHVAGRWVADSGEEFQAFSELGDPPPDKGNPPDTVQFSVSLHSAGASLLWINDRSQLEAKWITAPPLPTIQRPLTLPPTIPPTSDRTGDDGMSQPPAVAPSMDSTRSESTARHALKNRTVAAMMLSEGVTVTPSHQSSASGNLGAIIGAIVGVAGSILCIVGAILGIRRLRFRSSEDIGADGTPLEQSEANQTDDDSQSEYPCTVPSSANDGVKGQHYSQLPAAQESQYASVTRVSAPDYEQLELRPDGKDHYEALEPLNLAHDEYMSARMQRNYDDTSQLRRSDIKY